MRIIGLSCELADGSTVTTTVEPSGYINLRAWHGGANFTHGGEQGGPGRYLRAQATLRRWRDEARREKERREQLARMA